MKGDAPLKVGDLVAVRAAPRKDAIKSIAKLDRPWYGPCKVLQLSDEGMVATMEWIPDPYICLVRHMTDLKRFHAADDDVYNRLNNDRYMSRRSLTHMETRTTESICAVGVVSHQNLTLGSPVRMCWTRSSARKLISSGFPRIRLRSLMSVYDAGRHLRHRSRSTLFLWMMWSWSKACAEHAMASSRVSS